MASCHRPHCSLTSCLVRQADGELSGLPTPDSTPELPIKNLKGLRRHQQAKKQHCTDAVDADGPAAASGLGFVAVVGNVLTPQVIPFTHRHGNGPINGTAPGSSSTSLQLLEKRGVSGDECGGGAGGVSQAAADVSALDELLQHIQEVSASGTGGIKVLTSTSSSALFPGPPSSSGGHHHGPTRTHHYSHHHGNHHGGGVGQHHQQHIPETQSYRSTGAPPQNTSCNNPPTSPSSPLQQQVIPERPGQSVASVTRHHSQRHLVKMGSGGGGALPRHHSFNQRGALHTHFLARMNTNSSSNGPPGGGAGESRRPAVATSCLTRQHSYSGGPHGHRGALVRRTVSLKPQIPPKPLFLPNAAASPEAGTSNY